MSNVKYILSEQDFKYLCDTTQDLITYVPGVFYVPRDIRPVHAYSHLKTAKLVAEHYELDSADYILVSRSLTSMLKNPEDERFLFVDEQIISCLDILRGAKFISR